MITPGTIFAIGVLVTILCGVFVFLSAAELRRLEAKSPSDDGRWLSSK